MNNIIRKTALGFLAAMALTACDSYVDDNWAPGEPVAEGVQGAFFSTDNASGFSVSDSTHFNIIVSRVDSTEAATVPITIVSRDTTAIEIPTSVSFEAGKGTATITCNAEGLVEDTLYNFTIAIDSTQVNPYAAGSATFTATVVNGSLWVPVIVDAPTYFYYNGTYTYDFTYHTTIDQYLTTNYFYVENFLNSGGGFTFRITDKEDNYQSYIEDINQADGLLLPVDEEGVSVDDYGSWKGCSYYVNGDWTWEDTVNNVTWTSFYFYGGDGYATFKGTEKYIEIVCYPTVNGKGAFSTLYIDWR